MKPEYWLRAATSGDETLLLSLWESSVRATHDFLHEEDINFFRQVIINQQVFAAVDVVLALDADGVVTGFAGSSEGSLEMLFVHPDFLRQGVGAFLVEHLIRTAGINRVDVNEQNPAALKFYRQMGFEIADRSPLDGMGKPFPILHMRREVS